MSLNLKQVKVAIFKLKRISFWMAFQLLFQTASGFIIYKIVTMKFGSEGIALFGNLLVALSFFTCFIGAHSLSKNITRNTAYSIQKASRRHTNLAPEVRSSILISFTLWTLLGVLLLVSDFFFNFEYLFVQNSRSLIFVIWLFSFAIALFNFGVATENGKGNFKKVALLNIVPNLIVCLSLLLITSYMNFDNSLLLVYILSSSILFLTSKAFLSSDFSFKSMRHIKSNWLTLPAMIFWSSGILGTLSILYFRHLLTGQIGLYELGVFTALNKLSEGVFSLLSYFAYFYLLSKLTIMFANGRSLRVITLFSILMGIIYLIATWNILNYFGSYVINFLFAKEFEVGMQDSYIIMLNDCLKHVTMMSTLIFLAKAQYKAFIICELCHATSLMLISNIRLFRTTTDVWETLTLTHIIMLACILLTLSFQHFGKRNA